MSNKDFLVFAGKFICKECRKEVLSSRLWKSTGEVSWMCSDKHISKVNLIPQKRKKKDFDSE